MRVMRRLLPLVAGTAIVAGTMLAAPYIRDNDDRFQHAKHATLFPSCTTCHTGVIDSGSAMWPEPAQCASCHDGIVKPRVTWDASTGPNPDNLRFTHGMHHVAVMASSRADSTLVTRCESCHTAEGAPRMAVQHAVVGRCLDCHNLRQPHLELPSQACASCHVRLTEARQLTANEIANFPRPRSHDVPDFTAGGHGRQARVPGVASGPQAIAASCATCHARNLCLACHVNAPEQPTIMALAIDDRVPASPQLTRTAPPSHHEPDFLRRHGQHAERAPASCATCHTRESCASCHVNALPRSIERLPSAAAPGRAPGAHVRRTPPSSHTEEFRERHATDAGARPQSCETCHTRASCLECHRPDATKQDRYHAEGFLTRHPSAAYGRQVSCSDCHNPAQFCQACHQKSGLVATARLGGKGYHDAFRGFSLGHGQAARQSLESCAGCHAERDCTACHSAVGAGFRFSPHGPGFNAARMRAKNPSLCAACHGLAIPGGD
jgi:hypothetical protein